MSSKNLLYDDSIPERMNPSIEKQLRDGKHSLAGCNIFPEEDVMSYEMKLIKERFKEVVNRCKEAFDVDELDISELKYAQMPLVKTAMTIEEKHKDELIELAIKIVTDEFDIPEGMINFDVALEADVNFENNLNPTPSSEDEEFEDSDEIIKANKEVKKRRVINALIQGGSKKVNHIYHMYHSELTEMNPRLVTIYKRMMSLADMMYFEVPDLHLAVKGGMCELDFSSEVPTLKARAMVFPVLIHEIYKGVLEILSNSGMPKDKKIANYVIGKADFLSAESWDMRLGPQIWSRFMESLPDSAMDIKAHVYSDLCSLEPDEFNLFMKEIIGKTKKSKTLMKTITNNIEKELKESDYNESMGDFYFGKDDIL